MKREDVLVGRLRGALVAGAQNEAAAFARFSASVRISSIVPVSSPTGSRSSQRSFFQSACRSFTAR